MTHSNDRKAVLGIELAPDEWGRYRLALEVANALMNFTVSSILSSTLIGSTASGSGAVGGSPAGSGPTLPRNAPDPTG